MGTQEKKDIFIKPMCQDHQEHQEPKTWIGWLRAPNPVEDQASTATTTWRPSRTNVKPQSLSFLAAVAGNPH
ncbi:hypothetical protein QC764_0000340 [Podospora pseudoanserina]|uniref:Uncharacterized protein n=1 Tax=Podospora pseudoanserina TaxID=2609844 RepID=A0ABR0IK76_9PEZI|nr:hypothetical protein QC764_0000340 [Podospora pseudoanserina]